MSACKNLSSSQQTAFYTKLSKQLLTSAGVDAVVSRLRPLVRGRRSRAIKAEIKYFTGHLGHMKYAALLSEKLSIGSGAVESGIRRIVNLRFKAASIFWREDHVEPLLLLRAILKSGRWDAFLHGFLDRQYHLLPAQLDAVHQAGRMTRTYPVIATGPDRLGAGGGADDREGEPVG